MNRKLNIFCSHHHHSLAIYARQKKRANLLFQRRQTFKSVQKIIFWAFSGRQDGGSSQLLSNYKGDRITGFDSAQN